MEPSITALDDIYMSRMNFLKKICHANEGTVADWKIINSINAEITNLKQIKLQNPKDLTTLSRQVKNLVEKGFLLKRESELDHRSYIFKVARKGVIFRDNVNKALAEFDQKLFENWTNEEQGMFNILINRVLKNMIK